MHGFSGRPNTLFVTPFRTPSVSNFLSAPPENGIGLSTLHKWLQHNKNLTKPQGVQAWVPVVTVTPENTDELLVQIGKCTIPVAKHTDVQLLSTVLKVIINVC